MTIHTYYGANNNGKTNKLESIYFRITHKGWIKNISTGIQVKKEFWNFSKKELKDFFKITATSEEREHLKQLKETLQGVKNHFDSSFTQLQLENNTPTNKDTFYSWCKITYDSSRVSNANSDLLQDLWKEYIDHQKSQGMARSTLKQYESRLTIFKKFEESKGRVYTVKEINLTFWKELAEFYKSRPDSTAKYMVNHGETIKKIKAIINHYAPLKEIAVSPEFYHKSFKVTKGEKKRDWITVEEFKALESFEGSNYLMNTKKLAIIQYYTASRFGEVAEWLNSGTHNIETIQGSKYLTMSMPKSGKMGREYTTKTFPIHPSIENMIVNNTLPHAISNSKFNEYTREIFKTLNLSTGFEGSHTFRRSFATHKFNEKAPLKDIMQFTGHDKESTLLGYIHKNNVDVNNSITFS